MRKKMNTVLDGYRRDDPTLAAMEEMQSYCLAHPGVQQRCAGLGCQCGAISGLRSLGRLWRKGSLGLDRAWKRHSALSMRNILAF